MNNYFCVLPFFSYEKSLGSDQNIYCCRLVAGTNIQEVQQAIKNKQRSSACAACWKLEDQGLQSERQIHNQTFDYYADCDLELIEQDAVVNGFSPKIIKLATSTLCNGTCITCGYRSSTAWAKLENQSAINYNVMDTSKINFKEIVQLSFVGGEPLLEKKNFSILEELVSLGNTDCFISLVTNGSISINQKHLSLLSRFKNINICVSIDGIGTRFEYIRWPLKWNQLEHNLRQFDQITQNLSVSCMISNLNIFYYTELIDFFESNQLKYLCKPVLNPSYFAPGNLSDHFKTQVLANNKKYLDQVKSFLEYGPVVLEKFWQEIDRQDKLKGINIENYLPQLATTRI
jgi:sulfatase maturation enzyme AslB (radical SAM superfamily)